MPPRILIARIGRLLERRYLTQALQDPKYAGEDLTEDLAIVARRKADSAGHFPEGLGRVKKEKSVNEWVIGGADCSQWTFSVSRSRACV